MLLQRSMTHMYCRHVRGQSQFLPTAAEKVPGVLVAEGVGGMNGFGDGGEAMLVAMANRCWSLVVGLI